MGRKIYIGNLSYNVNDQALAELFEQFGQVDSAQVIIDRETRRSKGFAFVEMSTDEEASAAIAKLNGTDQGGRAINVSEAKPMVPREDNNRKQYRSSYSERSGY